MCSLHCRLHVVYKLFSSHNELCIWFSYEWCEHLLIMKMNFETATHWPHNGRIYRRYFAVVVWLSSQKIWTIFWSSYNVTISAAGYLPDILPRKITSRYFDRMYTRHRPGICRIFCKLADNFYQKHLTDNYSVGRPDIVRMIYGWYRAVIPQICRRHDIITIFHSTSRVVLRQAEWDLRNWKRPTDHSIFFTELRITCESR